MWIVMTSGKVLEVRCNAVSGTVCIVSYLPKFEASSSAFFWTCRMTIFNILYDFIIFHRNQVSSITVINRDPDSPFCEASCIFDWVNGFWPLLPIHFFLKSWRVLYSFRVFTNISETPFIFTRLHKLSLVICNISHHPWLMNNIADTSFKIVIILCT